MKKIKRIIPLIAAAAVAAGMVPDTMVNASAAETVFVSSGSSSDSEDVNAASGNDGNNGTSGSLFGQLFKSREKSLEAGLQVSDDDGNITEDRDYSLLIENENGFDNGTYAVFSKADGNTASDAASALGDVIPEGFDMGAGWIISVCDKDGNSVEPDGISKATIYMPDSMAESLGDAELYHIKDGKDGSEAEKLDFEVYRPDEDAENREGDEDENDRPYVSFETESFSPFVFVYRNGEKDTDVDDGGISASESIQSVSSTRARRRINAQSGIYIRTLSTQLFYGASRQDDGTYLWNVPVTVNGYEAGHRFNYRINFSISGVGTAAVDTIEFRVPKSTLKGRNGRASDTVEFSIPSRDDVTAATDTEGNISDEIDGDVNYAWYTDDDDIVIYNFREVPAGDNGYIEMSYVTSKNSFFYKDMGSMTPFICTMQIGDGTAENTKKTADPITTKINTTARINSTYKQRPYNKVKKWDDSWGSAVKPADTSKYYYLVWNIRSDITATQPYNFTIADTLTSNLGGMTILGYRFAGQRTYQTSNTVSNQTATGTRWDSVLTAVPLDTYQSATYWQAVNSETATVTPVDGVDSPSDETSSATWSWSKPVFHEPGGSFDSYKRGDGAYRTYSLSYSIYRGTNHSADGMDFKAGEYTRYDLEQFDGYDGEEKTLTEYDNFDYASWMIGYPTQWTKDTAASTYDADSPWTAYNNKPVKFELTDEGVYLVNDESGLISDDGSTNRTIENGGIDGTKAVKLNNNDFRINKLQFSWYLQDADYDNEETGEYQTKDVTYQDTDVVVFEGKFNGSDTWTKFATYNLKTKAASPVSTYVDSMTVHGAGEEIVFKSGQDLTAYRVTTANAHYYTEIFTVPFITLKNSSTVLNLLNSGRQLALVNNNKGKFYQLNSGVTYSGADYETLMSNASNWTGIVETNHSDTDYAEAAEKDSSITKKVLATNNNTKRKYYTITWQLEENETIISGAEGTMSYLPQTSGVFYDLLPEGSIFIPDSVDVSAEGVRLSNSDFEVSSISNYNGTGRTMVVINIKKAGSYYTASFDTRHAWSSIKDFGVNVYNPVAYETGNDSITKGYPDNGGTAKKDGTANDSPIKDAGLMKDLSKNTGITSSSVTGEKFIFAESTWDISALTSASSGLTKKVKAKEDRSYSTDTMTHINGEYSYEIRFMNSFTSSSKDMILFDSLENYDSDTQRDYGTKSDWRGAVSSIDTTQLALKGIAPVVYISTKSNLDIETAHNVSDTSVWTKVTNGTDLSKAKAIAIDMRKKTDGKDFTLDPGDSVVAYLYMKAPSVAPDAKSGNAYPYAYNNIYISDTVFDPSDADDTGLSSLIHQDYTRIGLIITGDLDVLKTSSKTGLPVSGITFRLHGTSDYGTAVDLTRFTDGSGTFSVNDLEKGTYILQETDATDDYLLDPTEHTVQIDNTGKTLVDGADYTGSSVTFANNSRVHTDISFRKVDAIFTSTRLQGAEFRLSGTSDYGTDTLATSTSDEKGNVSFTNIEKGTYKLKETAAPADHILDDTEYTVIIDNDANFGIYKTTDNSLVEVDKQGVTYLLKNEPLHYFTFTKKSSYDNSALGGAEFSLTGTSDRGTAVSMTSVSDDGTGTVRFEKLESGNYILTETKAPEDHDLDSTTRIVSMKSDGTYTITGLTKSDNIYDWYNIRKRNKKITITKVWDDGETANKTNGTTRAHTKTDSDGNVVQDPDKLGITITTEVPEASQRTYTIIYDANGGTF